MAITLERIPHDKQVAVYALHNSGYSYPKISKALDISCPTVGYILKQIPADLGEVDRYKKQLIAYQYSVSQRSINRITDEKLDQMNALQLMTINAIGIDKADMMQGNQRPTFNIVTVVNETKQALESLRSLKASLV